MSLIPPPSAKDDLLAKTGYQLAQIAMRRPENPLDFSIAEKQRRRLVMEGSYLSKLQKYEKLKHDNLMFAKRLENTKSDITKMNLKLEAKR